MYYITYIIGKAILLSGACCSSVSGSRWVWVFSLLIVWVELWFMLCLRFYSESKRKCEVLYFVVQGLKPAPATCRAGSLNPCTLSPP